MWFIGVEVEQETSAPPPKKKNPGSAPANGNMSCYLLSVAPDVKNGHGLKLEKIGPILSSFT